MNHNYLKYMIEIIKNLQNKIKFNNKFFNWKSYKIINKIKKLLIYQIKELENKNMIV